MLKSEFDELVSDAQRALNSGYSAGSERFEEHLNAFRRSGKGLYGATPLASLSVISFAVKKGKNLENQIALLEMLVSEGDAELIGNAILMCKRIQSQRDLLNKENKDRFDELAVLVENYKTGL